jgi:hypothetical protein
MYNQETLKLLIYVWSAGTISKGELSKRLGKKLTGNALKDLLEKLQNEQVLNISVNKQKQTISLTPTGNQTLKEHLYSPDFKFTGNQGARLVNDLMEWFRKNAVTEAKSAPRPISTYEEFKQVVVDTYDKIKKQFNYIKLVPVYRIRRELGDRVDREKFNEWMLEMHYTDVMRLHGGTPDETSEEAARDSIYSEAMQTFYTNVEKM